MVDVIEITVSGKVQTGKSYVLAMIADALDQSEYAFVFADRSFRNNPPPFDDASDHEKPKPDDCVIVLKEVCS
ncbi:MAG: hypothetical protein GOVbin631_71 [Prokaryotic dsDNA virus sp.]|nr:MAG: hypothetical protein GOVbin631_71 [Prokaryotic dsDNA virus sp.]|tara:strand:- start:27952 stop:28170 length:219 start_codon:yes stop_codon:yes gene_type:complete